MKKNIAILLIAGLGVVLIPGLALAQRGGQDVSKQKGANVQHVQYNEPEDCQEFSRRYSWGTYEYKYCTERKGTWHYVDNPGGNRNWTYHYSGTDDYQVKIEGRWSEISECSSEYDQKSHYLSKKGQIHLAKSSYESKNACTYTRDGNTYCNNYSYSGDYQFVNGKMKRNSYDYSFDACN